MPSPPDHGTVDVDVWHLDLDAGRRHTRRAAGLLDVHERRRAAAIRDQDAAHRYVLAHGALRTVLAGYLGVEPQDVTWTTGRNGKPLLTGSWQRRRFNLSRSGRHALLAVSGTAEVGVDCERVDRHRDPLRLAARFLPADEAAHIAAQPTPEGRAMSYHRLLSRREACAKASGSRILDSLRLPVLATGLVHGAGPLHGRRWLLRDLPPPAAGYVAALAVVHDRPGQDAAGVRHRRWDWRALDADPANRLQAAWPTAASQTCQ